jgi:SAM-dependent methyltransferase
VTSIPRAGPTPFTADPDHVKWFGDRIVRFIGAPAPRRVLDIGCGDGSLLLYLAQSFPSSTLVGVDLSAANVAAARAAVARSPHRGRIEVNEGDYLRLQAGDFDLVAASSSLQGIPVTTDCLAAKIARDVAPAGRLVHFTPYRCVYNSALNGVRRVLKQFRGSTTDRCILMAARALHPRESTHKLRERIDYMYLVLRHDEQALRAALVRRGFEIIACEPGPHTSLGQPKHCLAVMSAPFERGEDAARRAGPARR